MYWLSCVKRLGSCKSYGSDQSLAASKISSACSSPNKLPKTAWMKVAIKKKRKVEVNVKNHVWRKHGAVKEALACCGNKNFTTDISLFPSMTKFQLFCIVLCLWITCKSNPKPVVWEVSFPPEPLSLQKRFRFPKTKPGNHFFSNRVTEQYTDR